MLRAKKASNRSKLSWSIVISLSSSLGKADCVSYSACVDSDQTDASQTSVHIKDKWVKISIAAVGSIYDVVNYKIPLKDGGVTDFRVQISFKSAHEQRNKTMLPLLERTRRILSSSSLSYHIHGSSSLVNNFTRGSLVFFHPMCETTLCGLQRSSMFRFNSWGTIWPGVRRLSNSCVGVMADNDGVVRFSFGDSGNNRSSIRVSEREDKGSMVVEEKEKKKNKVSRKQKLNELRFYRLKARKKMKSPNPEVRIRYKLEKAKRKETWLIEKLRKFDSPKPVPETYDPESLTEEEKFYLKRTGEKKKHYVPVGRRGVFGGVVLNMHLHWKNHETVKVVCKPCRPGQVQEIADELSRLSKGIVIDILPNNIIIFYRGKNYVQPKVMSPPDTLSKAKALEKYKYQQSLEHTSQFIERLEEELEAYHEHVARYKKRKDDTSAT